MDIELLPKLRQIDPDTFEHFIAYLWEQFGWEAKVTTRSRDGGIDIITVQRLPTRHRHGIQAKRYAEGSRVSASTIREAAGQLNDGFDSVSVVTTGGFTGPAKEDAERLGVAIVDGEDIIRIVEEANISTEDLSQFITIRLSELFSQPSNDNARDESNIDYTADKSNIEYQATNSQNLTHKKHKQILSIHLSEYSKKENDNAFLNYFVRENGSTEIYCQIIGYIFNINSLSDGQLKIAKAFCRKKPNLRIEHVSEEHNWIQVACLSIMKDGPYGEIRLSDINGYATASANKKLLNTVHDITLEDIVAIEAYNGGSSKVWNLI